MSTKPWPVQSWREPTSLLRLRWGTYRERYLAGLTLIVGGSIQIQGSNTWALVFLLIGAVATAVGWSILPARGGRRVGALLMGTLSVCVLLTGPQSVWVLTVTVLGWLLVRDRPALSYVTLIIPLGLGIVVSHVFREYSGMPGALTLGIAGCVAAAWLARLIAAHQSSSRPLR